MVKITKYHILARARRYGKTVTCSVCGRDNHIRTTKLTGITCDYCLMGMADSVLQDSIPKPRKLMRLKVSNGKVA